MVVTGSIVEETPRTAPTVEKAVEKAKTVPGGASVINVEEVSHGAVNNITDLLSNQPGIQIRDAGGRNESTTISVRGAGTNHGGPYGNTSKGVSILVNGLPVTSPGAFAFETPDTLATSHLDVLRGASALTLGSFSLGGGINYLYHTGYTADPFKVRFDVGSFGYHREHFSSGYVYGPYDYYFSLTNFKQDGWRHNQDAEAVRLHFNIGYTLKDQLENRLFFSYIDSRNQNPRLLTAEQMYANPRQTSPELGVGERNGTKRDAPGTYLVQNQTVLHIDEASSLEFNVHYLHFPTETNGSRIVPLDRSTVTYNDNGKIAAALIYNREDAIFGHRSKTRFALVLDHLLYQETRIEGDYLNPNPGLLFQEYDHGGTDFVAALSNEFDLLGNERLWLSTAFAVSYKTRDATAIYPTEDYNEEEYSNWAPQLGLRYDVSSDFQIFGNITRLTETPATQRLGPTTAAPYLIPDDRRGLKEQEAWASEIGIRGKAGIFEGGLGYYYQYIKNEILTVGTINANGDVETRTSNATPTIHRGVEVNFKATLWESAPEYEDAPAVGGKQVALGKNAAPGSRGEPVEKPRSSLVLNASYTWADNYHKDDPVLGTNELPGLAPHYYAAELLFKHKSGFYAGVNVQGVPRGYPIDYSNTHEFDVEPYVLLGAKLGYVSPKKGWEAYLEFRNLTDEIYTSVINPIWNADAVRNNNASLATHWPGDGFNISAGVTYRF